MIQRRASRRIYIKDVAIGDGAPISVQSMTTTDTRDVGATLDQIHKLFDAGCDIVRLAVPDKEAAEALKQIVTQSPIPVVADIHFDYRLALQAADNGVHALRINPGNLPRKEFIKKVVEKAKERQLPIRIGVNAGSLEKEVREKYPNDIVQALVESALLNIRLLEEEDFFDMKISVKASNPLLMMAAYRDVSTKMPYALHLGVTEAGTLKRGLIKSAIGIGTLLGEGIGDTIRVSLTADSVEEVTAGHEILKALGLRAESADLISCPSCGRAEVDLHSLANQVEALIAKIKLPVRVAVMGCFVNGPGESAHADLGIAGGRDEFFIFEGMEVVRRVKQDEALKAFTEELYRFLEQNQAMLEARALGSPQQDAILSVAGARG
jgi:(E)-4-hydroxy-3-methylbut-2-enyl-diphosphate synthase